MVCCVSLLLCVVFNEHRLRTLSSCLDPSVESLSKLVSLESRIENELREKNSRDWVMERRGHRCKAEREVRGSEQLVETRRRTEKSPNNCKEIAQLVRERFRETGNRDGAQTESESTDIGCSYRGVSDSHALVRGSLFVFVRAPQAR